MQRKKEIAHLKDLTPDPRNSRRHNPRNIGMVEQSLRKYGAARSIVIDEAGKIIAGHGVVEAAANAGIEKVNVVDASGNEIVAVRRTGLTEKEKAELSIADNRSSDLSDFDPNILKELSTELDLGQFWDEKEMEHISHEIQRPVVLLDQAVQLRPQREYVVILCADDDGTEFQQLRQLLELKQVQRGGYPKNSPFNSVGTERVIAADRILTKLLIADVSRNS